jgi:hypothetical protein
MFDIRERLSGMVVGTQISFALGRFAPAIAAAVQGPNGWLPVAALTFAACVIAAVAAWTARETFRMPMEELGRRTS